MASIIKRTYTAVVDGKRVQRKCRHWTIQYRDASGRIKRVKGYTDKGATKQLAAKLEQQQARGEQMMVDPYKAHRHRPLDEHFAEYLADLEGSGCDAMYVYNQRRRLARLRIECGWACLDDIEPNSFIRWRDRERKDDGTRRGRMGKGTSATTLNQYLSTVRAFTNWCATVGRMPGVPTGRGKRIATALAGVETVTGEKRRKRRALEDAQLVTLLTMFPERALVYRFGIATGLRRSELEDLLWGDVRLNAIPAYLQLRAEATKANRGDRIPLPQTLAEDLRTLKTAGVSDGARVFEVVPSLDQWKADLAAAGIPYKDAMGRQLDFHGGCRQTLCTRLHRQGVPQREAMRRMRVTDPKLLNDVYADDVQLASLAAPMPELLPTPAAPNPGVSAG
jgi:integrase